MKNRESQNSEHLVEALARFQEATTTASQLYREYSGVPSSGLIGSNSLLGLGMLRCGNARSDFRRTLRTNPWGKNQLLGCFRLGDTPEDEPAKPMEVFRRAFKAWSEHIPLTYRFGNMQEPCDIKISWEPTLCGGIACTDFPPNGEMIVMRFSDEVRWAHAVDFPLPDPHPDYMDNIVDLQAFATHEFGHALGLDDDYDDESSIMFYQIANGKRSLSPRDIANVQAIYGSV